MAAELTRLAWRSASDLAEALARHAGLKVQPVAAARLDSDVEHACASLGLEAEHVALFGGRVREQLRQSTPALLPWKGSYLGLARCRKGAVVFLAPDLSLQSVEMEMLRDALCADAEAAHESVVREIIGHCAIPDGRKERARRALLEERVASERIGAVWQLSVRPGSSFVRQLRDAGLIRRLLLLGGAHAGECLLWMAAWWMLAQSAFDGRVDRGLLTAWVLTLLTIVTLRVSAARSMGLLGLGVGGLLKQRLLAGALGLEGDQIRRQGAGQLLGRVMESDAVESMALAGGLTALMAGFEFVLSALVLALGAGGLIQPLLLIGWACVTGVLCRRYARRREQWTGSRLEMTHDLIEKMTGHRTRMVQSLPGKWHDEEDEALERYYAASAAMDREHARLTVLASRGWVVIGLAGLAPALLSAGPSDLASTAVGLGGILLAQQAFRRLAGALSSVAGAAISWKQIAELFHAASRSEPAGVTSATVATGACEVMRAQEVHFSYPHRGEPVLRGATFHISRGDWVLLEGRSGGGKSTLASLMAGLRQPNSGLLLAGGLDYRTLGARRWRLRVSAAPQYHENHIFTETLAFNLLMSRRWPPTEAEYEEAESVCRELGLGELLERMPAGMQQLVGETGWQLSQGERSRVFIARALLQRADLGILDESFAALDPENARRCLECVLKRSESLVVVTHP